MVYRCKNCGQIVIKDVNKVCPACRVNLAGNMVKCTSAQKRKKKRVGLFLVIIVIGVLLALYFTGYLQKVFDKVKELDKGFADQTVNSPAQLNSPFGITNSNTKSGRLSYKSKSYFVYYKDTNFGNDIVKYFENTFIGNADDRLFEFNVSEYENGGDWIRVGEDYADMLFFPADKVEINGEMVQLLIPIDALDMATVMLPNSYRNMNDILALDSKGYAEKVQAAYEIVEKRILGNEEMDVVFVSKMDDKQLVLSGVSIKYDFGEYSKIKTENGIVYETGDGKRYSNYIEMPHSILLNQEKAAGDTILYSEIRLESD